MPDLTYSGISVYAIAFFAAYALGSVPFGLLLTKSAGLGDIRDIGSGNIGATNVLRTGNRKLAAATLLLDMLKGTAAVIAAGFYAGPDTAMAAAIGAFLGHLFPVFFRFQGGKGVATALGVLLGYSWVLGLAVAASWLIVAVFFRYSSLASLVAAVFAPVYYIFGDGVAWYLDKSILLAMALMSLLLLGLIIVSSTDLFHNSTKALFTISLLPLALLLVVIILPPILKRQGNSRIAKVGHAMHDAMIQVRQGLAVFKQPRIALPATFLQVGAWAIQLASCWALMFALGLDHRAGLAASAAVLFAVNVTAVVPATPSNIGIFQLAVISVLHTGWGVSTADALAYGVILQAVEIATAVGLGLPALFREGLTWSDLRTQALATSTVELNYKPRREKHSRVGDTI